MAKKIEKNLTWQDVDVDTIKGDVKAKREAYQESYKASQAKRLEFEAAFIAAAKKAKQIKDDETIRFGYSFGKLRVAVDKADEPKAANPGAFRL